MSKKCVICKKKPMTGNTVSHSHRKSKRRFSPNLKKIMIAEKKVWICTSCLKKRGF